MLIGKVTEKGTGMKIFGDYFDLDSFYTTIHFVAGKHDENHPVNTLLLSLAYEIRKAKQGSRYIEDMTPFNGEPTISYKATDIVLPYFVVQLSTLRDQLKYFKTDENLQANVYAAERLCKEALIAKHSSIGLELYEWAQHFPFTYEKYVLQLLDMVVIDFLNTPAPKRFARALPLLKNYFMHSKKKEEAVAFLEIEAAKMQCPTDKLSFDWPEIEW